MRLCVFGASGPVGRAVVTQALDAGHQVTAVTRHPDRYGPAVARLRVTGGDVLEPPEVEAALEGADAVVSAVGVPFRRQVTTYSHGTRNVVTAMQAQGIRRIVCVSSKGVSGTGHRDEPFLYRFVVAPLLGRSARPLYDDMRRMERVLAESDRDWTVVRPAGLYAADRVTGYRCTARHEPGVFTSIADLGHALIQEAVGAHPHVAQTVEVLTDEGTPPYLLLMARQGRLHRR